MFVLRCALLTFGLILGVWSEACADGPLEVLGMVGVRQGRSGRYLQAHTDGELHASNEHRNEEETWFLCAVDKPHHIYALVNWRNHRFMSAHSNGCARADSVILSNAEKWELISGRSHGFENAYAIRSVGTGHYLGAQDPGHDLACGGEVGCGTGAHAPIPPGGRNDNGWWVFEKAEKPTPGGPSFNDIVGVVVRVAPVAASIIAAL